MKIFFLLAIFLFISSCGGEKFVYWCGDHECINKKERIAYFEKTMILEIKNANEVKKNDTKNKKEIKKQLKL